jgi:hypothetical protein
MRRMNVARGFARHMTGIDPGTAAGSGDVPAAPPSAIQIPAAVLTSMNHIDP